MKEEEKGGWEGIRGRERERVRGGRMRIARSEQSEWVSEWEEVHSFLFRGGGGKERQFHPAPPKVALPLRWAMIN